MTTHIDPVCGMTVDPTKNKGGSFDYDGTTYYFCSPGCRTKFEANPAGWLESGPKGMGGPTSALRATAGKPVEAVTLTLKRPATKPHQSTPAPEHASTAPEHESTRAPEHQIWICPMDPEVRSTTSGDCPKCGMALEPEVSAVPSMSVEWTCPMHPEVVRSEPGACPICGMALEPRTVTAAEPENHELKDMTRRFWGSVVLTAPLTVLAMMEMSGLVPISARMVSWIQLALATPVCLWAGWPFFVRAVNSVRNR